MFQAFSLGIEGNKKNSKYKCKNDVYETVIGDVVAHLKPQKSTALSDL